MCVSVCALALHIFPYFIRASSLVPQFSSASARPVSKFTLDNGFFNRLSPICTSFSKFFVVQISTEASTEVNVSS